MSQDVNLFSDASITASPKRDGIDVQTTIQASQSLYQGVSSQDLQYWLEAEDLSAALYKAFKHDQAKSDCALFTNKKIQFQLACFNSKEQYQVIEYSAQKVNTKDLGINAFILTPKNLDADSTQTPEVKVIFAGTKDTAGILRDIEPKSPGHASYYKAQKRIMTALNQALVNLPRKKDRDIKISVIGHSLGATDAQRTALAITKTRMNDSTSFAGYNIHLNLVSNSSPKVTIQEANDFTQALYYARKQGLKFGSLICKYNLDFIPKFGVCDIRTGKFTPEHEKRPIDTFDLADNGIKILYGKTYYPFLHESPAYDRKQKSKLHAICSYQFNPHQGGQKEKRKMKKIMNKSTTLDKIFFARLMKNLLTQLRKHFKILINDKECKQAISLNY